MLLAHRLTYWLPNRSSVIAAVAYSKKACTRALRRMSGCASTQKRYDKAEDFELQGRYAEAADYYIKVLEKEPDWEGAPERLQETGNQAIVLFFEEADAAQARGN